MQIIKSLFKLVIIVCPIFATAQSTNLQQGDKAEHVLDRIDIKQQHNYDLILSINKPISRKTAVNVVQMADSLNKIDPSNKAYALSKVDQYDLQSVLADN